jgi:hypothetical protein
VFLAVRFRCRRSPHENGEERAYFPRTETAIPQNAVGVTERFVELRGLSDRFARDRSDWRTV